MPASAELAQLKRMLQTGALQLDIRGPSFHSNEYSAFLLNAEERSAAAEVQRHYTVARPPKLPLMQFGSCRKYGCMKCANIHTP
jgi:hypothetical protein